LEVGCTKRSADAVKESEGVGHCVCDTPIIAVAGRPCSIAYGLTFVGTATIELPDSTIGDEITVGVTVAARGVTKMEKASLLELPYTTIYHIPTASVFRAEKAAQ